MSKRLKFAIGVLANAFIMMNIIYAEDAKKVEIIAHRGASHDAPENTLAALRLGFEQGADAGELDVWISQDGVPVVIHDADTKRVTAGSKQPVTKKVVEQTWDELRQLDVGSWKNAHFAGEPIPLLTAALAIVPAGKRMFVEIKCGPEGVPPILHAIDKSGLKPEQTPVISFNAKVVAAVKKSRPDLAAYWIVSLKEKSEKPGDVPKVEDLITQAQAIHADGLDVSGNNVVDSAFVAKVRAAKLKLYTWTIDKPDIARRLAALHIDGITTNRPEWLRKEMGRE